MEDYIYTVYGDLPRQGPGGNRWTAKAFSLIEDTGSVKKILDLGCGSGMQTLELLRLSKAHVTAVDVHEPFLDVIKQKAEDEGFSDRITTITVPMEDLQDPEEKYDVVWAEGSLYNMGLEKALKKFHSFIKPDGYLIFTEVVFTKPDLPQELIEFWEKEYPDMRQQLEVHLLGRECGYLPIACLAEPDEAWWVHYYNYLKNNISDARTMFGNIPEAMELVKTVEQEMEIRRKFPDYYTNVFYIFKKA